MRHIIALLACAVLLAVPSAYAQDGAAPVATTVPVSEAQVKLSYAPIVKKVAPSVVNIYTKRVVTGRAGNPFIGDPFFAPFFGNMAPMRKRVEQSLGSGVIVDASGLIVTNAHVIKDAQEIVAVLSNGHEYPAKSVLVDEPSDLGLLRIDAGTTPLPVAKLAPSDGLEVGDIVLAIGNPFGVGQTVTSGIISALARSNTNVNDFDFFIQTDAAINPGNSGGPLVSMDGTVIGINSAIYSRNGGSLGIGFAVPADMVMAVIAAEKSGQVSKRGVLRPWLGFTSQNVTADIGASIGLEKASGALVVNVVEGGPADKAGLQRGDIITALDSRDIRDADELKFRIATLPMGSKITMHIRRDDKDQTLEFTAAPPPEKPTRDPVTLQDLSILQGATVINVSPAVIEEMDIKSQDDGVVVFAVRDNSPAARIGLQAGDGIIAIGDRRVSDTRKLQALIKDAASSQRWVLTIRRDGRDQTIILR